MREDDVLVIRLPKFSGYKTLVVNAIIMVAGLAAVIYPQFQPPTAETVGLLFDQGSGAIIAVVGVINLLLRLVTDSPVGFKRERERSYEQVVDDAMRERSAVAQPEPSLDAYMQAVRDAVAVDTADKNTDNIDVESLPKGLPAFMAQGPSDKTANIPREDTQ